MLFYFSPLSPNSRRPWMTARHLGLPLDEKVVDVFKDEHKSPEFLKINPNGMVPALVDGDFKLWESRAIMEYLAAQKPEAGLLGENDREWADLARWLFWDACHLSRHTGSILYEHLVKELLKLGPPDQAAVKAAAESLRRFYGVLDGALADKDYLVGDRLTVADICLGCTFSYAGVLKLPVGEHPHVKAWLARVTALPAWAATEPPM